MEDWKEKLRSLKKNGTLKKTIEPTPTKKIQHNPNIINKSNNHVLNPTIFCNICKKKINKDLFKKHLLEIHKIRDPELKENNLEIEQIKNIANAYSSPTAKIEDLKKTKQDLRDFKKIKDLNIELSDFKDFKEPDDWIINFNNSVDFNATDAFDINLGLDIGTSYTKAIIEFREDKFAVDWRGISNFEDPFTLPSELSITDKKISIGRNPSAQKIISSFKVKLLQNNIDDDYKYAFVSYLKIVFFYIRAWWDHHYSDLYTGKTLYWNINIGLPLKNMSEFYIVDLYKNITREAWERSYIKNRDSLDKNSFTIEHFPEYSSQINTYLNSPRRQRGLHLLVDIGAGTTDICTFIVTENQDNDLKLPGMTSTVLNYGTHTLNNERYDLINYQKSYTETLSTEDFIKKYPIINKEELKKIDKNFIGYIAKEIKKVLGITKSKKYNTAPEWKNGLITFMCGGGVNSNVYKEIFQEAQISNDLFSRFHLIDTPLEKPENIKSRYTINNFHRISVAYGLSYSSFRQPIIDIYEIDDQINQQPKKRDDFGGAYDK